MELAYLHRQSLENPWNARPAVQDDRGELESPRLDIQFQERVMLLGLRRYPSPSEIRFERRRSRGQEDVFSDVSGVENADDFLRRRVRARSCFSTIQYPPYRPLAHAVRLLEVVDRLPFPHVVVPDLPFDLLRPSLILKLFAAIRTAVVLDAPSFSVLLYPRFSAVRTLFLRMVCS